MGDSGSEPRTPRLPRARLRSARAPAPAPNRRRRRARRLSDLPAASAAPRLPRLEPPRAILSRGGRCAGAGCGARSFRCRRRIRRRSRVAGVRLQPGVRVQRELGFRCSGVDERAGGCEPVWRRRWRRAPRCARAELRCWRATSTQRTFDVWRGNAGWWDEHGRGGRAVGGPETREKGEEASKEELKQNTGFSGSIKFDRYV